MKIGIADYGMYVWYGGLFDYEERLKDIKALGYDGLERLRPITESDAIHKAAMVRKMGMDFGTCLAPDVEHSIQWTAALGKQYVWTAVTAKDFDGFCRQVNAQTAICKKWGVEAALHNHLGTLVETQAQLLAFLECCPDCKLVLDIGHLAVAEGGDPLAIVENYYDRIAAVHVKDWVSTDPEKPEWYNRGYFCELGGGNVPIDHAGVVAALKKKGYDGWIFVEHDTHKQDPLVDLKKSREYLRNLGL